MTTEYGQEMEKMIQDSKPTAPRVTLEDFNANITDVEVFKVITKTGKIMRWAVLTTKSGHTEFYGKVSDIAKTDERLYQSHRAYVVNPANILRVDAVERMVYFEQEESCLVSRMKLKGLLERVGK